MKIWEVTDLGVREYNPEPVFNVVRHLLSDEFLVLCSRLVTTPIETFLEALLCPWFFVGDRRYSEVAKVLQVRGGGMIQCFQLG